MKLVHNTPIKIRDDYKIKKGKSQISALKDLKKMNQRTEKPERVYFLWFHYLKLLLEMEKKKLSFKRGYGTSLKEFVVGKDIKIDKKFYREWDLNEVLTYSFDKWWNGHINLFEKPSTLISDTPDGWTSNSNFRFIRVDTRNDYTTIIRDVQRGMKDLKGKGSGNIFKYKINGDVRYHNELLRYNIMVRTLNGEEDLYMFENERDRFKEIERSDKGKTLETGTQKRESELSNLEKQWKKFSSEEKKKKDVLSVKVKKVVAQKWKRTTLDSGKIVTEFNKEYYEGEHDENVLVYMRGNEKDYKSTTKTVKGDTEGSHVDREFRNCLRGIFSRMVTDTQRVMNGVSQGMFRKQVKFY